MVEKSLNYFYTTYLSVLFKGNFETIILPIQKVFNFRKVLSCNLESARSKPDNISKF